MDETRGNANSVPDEPTIKRESKLRPTKTLPTDRITFDNQLKILRAWAAASMSGKTATNEDVAAAVGMKASTITLANPFFASIGLLTKTESGYNPASVVLDFFRATDWDEASAALKLAPVIRDTWFALALMPTLAVGGNMSEETAIGRLADAASATKEYKSQLSILIDYLNASGLLVKEGDQIKKGRLTSSRSPADESTNTVIQPKGSPPPSPRNSEPKVEPANGVSFDVSLRVDMAEFATWSPDRIKAFFNGLATVLSAKAGMEREYNDKGPGGV